MKINVSYVHMDIMCNKDYAGYVKTGLYRSAKDFVKYWYQKI